MTAWTAIEPTGKRGVVRFKRLGGTTMWVDSFEVVAVAVVRGHVCLRMDSDLVHVLALSEDLTMVLIVLGLKSHDSDDDEDDLVVYCETTDENGLRIAITPHPLNNRKE